MSWQSSEYILGSTYEYNRVLNIIKGSKYATKSLNMS